MCVKGDRAAQDGGQQQSVLCRLPYNATHCGERVALEGQ